MAKQEPKEVNELNLIWKEELLWNTNEGYKKARRNERLKEYHRNVFIMYRFYPKSILKFWTLKAKMDTMKQEIDHLEFELEEALREYEPQHDESRD